jgi:hypothetical protein
MGKQDTSFGFVGTSLDILFFIESSKTQICKQTDGSIAQR